MKLAKDVREFIALFNSHGVAPNRIDLVTAITGVDFDTAWATRESALLDDVPVNNLALFAAALDLHADDLATSCSHVISF